MEKELIKANINATRNLFRVLKRQLYDTILAIGSISFPTTGKSEMVEITDYDGNEYVLSEIIIDKTNKVDPITLIVKNVNKNSSKRLMPYQYDHVSVWMEILSAIDNMWEEEVENS